MTQQQARTELKQIRTYYNRIAERKQRLVELRSSMGNIKIAKYGIFPVRGATKGDEYRLETAIDRATQLETKISNDLIAMAEAQQRLIEKIERLPEPYATVLTNRYIHLLRLEKIAVEMNYSYDRTRHLIYEGERQYAQL